MKRLLLLIAVCFGVSLAYLKAYEVTPTQANWSGKVDGDPLHGGVGNTFTANFDSAVEVQVFVGDTGQSHAAVKVDIYEYPNGVTPVAYNDGVAQTKSHVWLNFPLTTVSGQKFVRGDTYMGEIRDSHLFLDLMTDSR
jgi:hypothetical protein